MSELERLVNQASGSIFKKSINFGRKYVDYKIGAIGALFMGSIVFGINYYEVEETLGSTTAALKQGAYTFLVGGSIAKFCEYFAINIKKKTLAITAAVVIPSLTTIGLTYGVHKLKGTPKPEKSTIPTVIVAPLGTAFWGSRKRRQMDYL